MLIRSINQEHCNLNFQFTVGFCIFSTNIFFWIFSFYVKIRFAKNDMLITKNYSHYSLTIDGCFCVQIHSCYLKAQSSKNLIFFMLFYQILHASLSFCINLRKRAWNSEMYMIHETTANTDNDPFEELSNMFDDKNWLLFRNSDAMWTP